MSDQKKVLLLSQAILHTCLEFFDDKEEFSPPIVMTAMANAMAFGLVDEFEKNGEAIRALSKMMRPLLKSQREIVNMVRERAERQPPKLELIWNRENQKESK